jgi:hypothetical protein
MDMDAEVSGTQANSNEEALPWKTARPPTITLTSTTNLLQLQKQLKIVVIENFEFPSTWNKTRVIKRGMADLQSVNSQFDANNLSDYAFYPKSEKHEVSGYAN